MTFFWPKNHSPKTIFYDEDFDFEVLDVADFEKLYIVACYLEIKSLKTELEYSYKKRFSGVFRKEISFRDMQIYANEMPDPIFCPHIPMFVDELPSIESPKGKTTGKSKI